LRSVHRVYARSGRGDLAAVYESRLRALAVRILGGGL